MYRRAQRDTQADLHLSATAWTLQALAADGTPDKLGANPPGDPSRIHPVATVVAAGATCNATDRVDLPAFSFVMVRYDKKPPSMT